MKIGILTQPLATNYGGLLQAFALQKFLREMGHEALTVDYRGRPRLRGRIKMFLRKIIRGEVFFQKRRLDRGIHCARFVRENIRTTRRILAPATAEDFSEYGFEEFVVGSDQTWRPLYSPYMPTFFLDFLGEEKTMRRVAYASSFGTDEWEFSPELTKICAALAKKFYAISVREDSGVALCKNFLGVPAEHLLDPTMLLEKSDYEQIVAGDEARGLLEPRGNERRVFAYILDEAAGKDALVAFVAKSLGATAEKIMPRVKDLREGRAVFPPVSAWLRGFRDAEFVVTDSFHGCVFSIIFNKPFLAIGNAARGLSRFSSLLNVFALEDRLLLSDDVQAFAGGSSLSEQKIRRILAAAPDWNRINAARSREQMRARKFLEDSLKK